MDDDQTKALGDPTPSSQAMGLVDPDDLPVGTIIGEYVTTGTLGAGGAAQVYAAVHRLLKRRVALKVLHRKHTNSVMVTRFVREAQIVNQIRHPNIVDISDFGELPDSRPYYVMEYLEGRNLNTILKTDGPFRAAEALVILEQVCSALHAAHEAGVVHRDLKSSNIMVVVDPTGALRIKLLDFGIAKLLSPDQGIGLTTQGDRLGTTFAMSPEQLRGQEIDRRTDVYALGILAFQMLTGRIPFRGERQILEALHLNAPPPKPSQFVPLSAAIDAAILRCLEKDAAARFPTALAFLEAFRQAVDAGGASDARPAGVAEAMGLLVQVAIEETSHDDEDLMAAAGDALDTAERLLSDAGFHLALQTGNALLGVALIPPSKPAAAEFRSRSLAVAQSIHAAAANLDPRLKMSVSLHADAAEVTNTVADTHITGGAIMGLSRWPKADQSIFVSPAARAVGC